MRMARRLITIIWLAALVAPYVAPPVLAAPTATAPATRQAGEGLELSPPVIELAANPGQTVSVSIRLRNVTTQTLLAIAKADDFGAQGEDGSPHILLDEAAATRFSLKYWVSPVSNLLMVSEEIKTATIKIVVPANAEPGGHFGVIRFTAVPQGPNGNGVALSASIGSLILLKVNGAITEKMNLIEQYVSHNNQKGSLFESGPIVLSQRIRNTGSVHLAPTGTIDITDTFGKNVASLKVNDPPRNVLPDSVRRFDETWGKKWLFGHYTAHLKLKYGSTSQVIAGTLGFWVIPYKLILITLLILIVVVIILRFMLRRYKRRIYDQARRANGQFSGKGRR